MVKGISKQIILVQSPDRTIFDQAIFILSDDAIHNHSVTDDVLLKEAKRILLLPDKKCHGSKFIHKMLYAGIGAVLSCMIWSLIYFL